MVQGENYELYNGDCLEIMKDITDKSIDVVLCDLPYNKLNAKWDKMIPMPLLWEQYRRIIKDNGAIILFAQQPFTSLVVTSNIEEFRHNIVWHKDKCANFLHAKNQPRKTTEDILVFSKEGSGFVHNSKNKCVYNPQMTDRKPRKPTKRTARSKSLLEIRGEAWDLQSGDDFIADKSYPENIIYFRTEHKDRFHPCQKPQELLQYLIRTYTNENSVILDNCMGSGSTGVAVLEVGEGRKFIGIELDENYFNISCERIQNANNKNN